MILSRISLFERLGYSVERIRPEGYRLTLQPEKIEKEPGIIIGKNFYLFEEIDSTNALAWTLALAGAEEGTGVIADAQRKGKGRRGRQWFSPAGINLYVTFIFRPCISPQKAPQLSLPSALATAKAIEKVTGIKPEIKWPNDILIQRKKVAGILLEMESHEDRVDFILIGIGVNINAGKDELPSEIKDLATSLRIATGKPIPRLKFGKSLFREMDSCYRIYLSQGLSSILPSWKNYSDIWGKRIEILTPKGHITGVALDLDQEGALLLLKERGVIERIISGEIQW